MMPTFALEDNEGARLEIYTTSADKDLEVYIERGYGYITLTPDKARELVRFIQQWIDSPEEVS